MVEIVAQAGTALTDDAKALITVLAATISLVGAIISALATLYARSIRREMSFSLVQPRLQAYRKLWSRMERASPSVTFENPDAPETSPIKKQLTEEDRKYLARRLRSWYFSNDGNGIFLSDTARKLFTKSLLCLETTDYSDEDKATRVAVERLSRLRTQTKNELGVYGFWGSRSDRIKNKLSFLDRD
jgi:hypothetical protein